MNKYDLSKHKPCNVALEYYATKDSFEQAWNDCPRGDWMLWIAQKLGVGIKPLTLAKARCAKTVIHLMKDPRSINAVEVAERFGLTDEVSEDDLRDASDAARAAAWAAYAAASAAANAAAWAAYAAANAADTDAAWAANAAANAADTDAARIKNQKQTADICIEILTNEVFKLITPE